MIEATTTETLSSVDPRLAPVKHSPQGRVRGALVLMFAVYLALLVWIVLWKLHVPFVGRDDMREIKLVPFAAGAGYGASAPFEVLGNMAIFLPFGVYLGLLVPNWPWWKVASLVAGASIVLEVAQYVSAVGSSDVTDVIVNTAGGLVGFGVLVVVRRTLQSRTAVGMTWILATGTAFALLAVGLIIASFPRLPHLHDVGAGPSGGVSARAADAARQTDTG